MLSMPIFIPYIMANCLDMLFCIFKFKTDYWLLFLASLLLATRAEENLQYVNVANQLFVFLARDTSDEVLRF